MTKDSKLSRISDSASGGKGESMASEIRAREWIAANYDNWFSARKAACKTMYGHEPVVELLAAYAESECSRLASRVEELDEQVAKLLAENLWMRSLSPEELSYRNGTIAGWQQAHEPAACGHARGNWKDPKYGTPEYSGDERCEVCELVKALRKRKPDAELKRVLRAANERCNRAKCNHKRLHHVNGICRAGKPARGRKSKCSCPAFQKAEKLLAGAHAEEKS